MFPLWSDLSMLFSLSQLPTVCSKHSIACHCRILVHCLSFPLTSSGCCWRDWAGPGLWGERRWWWAAPGENWSSSRYYSESCLWLTPKLSSCWPWMLTFLELNMCRLWSTHATFVKTASKFPLSGPGIIIQYSYEIYSGYYRNEKNHWQTQS